MDDITQDKACQEGAIGTTPGELGIPYNRFDFQAKHKRGRALAYIADRAGMPDLANRMAACGAALGFTRDAAGRHLQAANFCHARLCPMCAARLAKKQCRVLGDVLMEAARQLEGVQFLFLTLAPRNRADLKAGVDDLLAAWKRFCGFAAIKRATIGAYRAVEITYNREARTWHPHIHAILAVPSEYFDPRNDLYLTQGDYVRLWRRALRAEYDPTANVKALYDKRTGARGGTESAIREASKYATKDADIFSAGSPDDQAYVFGELVRALAGRRLYSYAGLLRRVARDLACEDMEALDLIDADEDAPLSDLPATIYEAWSWEHMAGDYMCREVLRIDARQLHYIIPGATDYQIARRELEAMDAEELEARMPYSGKQMHL